MKRKYVQNQKHEYTRAWRYRELLLSRHVPPSLYNESVKRKWIQKILTRLLEEHYRTGNYFWRMNPHPCTCGTSYMYYIGVEIFHHHFYLNVNL